MAFLSKFKDEDKTVDMSVLLPCESDLCLHSGKDNYIAEM